MYIKVSIIFFLNLKNYYFPFLLLMLFDNSQYAINKEILIALRHSVDVKRRRWN